MKLVALEPYLVGDCRGNINPSRAGPMYLPEASLLEKAGKFRFMVHPMNSFFVNLNEIVLEIEKNVSQFEAEG